VNPGSHQDEGFSGGVADPELLAALAGGRAGQERDAANRTRRVVLASLGVLQSQKAGRHRIRAVALASILVVLLTLGPLAWWALDNLLAGEHLGDLTCQFGVWGCILCPALVAAALVAGWWRNRS
jgi:hypothetical protein